jgi:transposase
MAAPRKYPDELRAELEPLTDHKLIQACAALDSEETVAAPEAAMRYVLGSLARRWLQLHAEIALHSRHLKALTTAAAPRLLELVGVGFDIAAELLVTAGDNTDRVRSEAAFAKMCGAYPIPAGSGRTNGRHRLYRGGNRQANAALYRAVIVRMRCTSRRSTTSPAAPPRACPSARSSAASSATSPARPTGDFHPPAGQPRLTPSSDTPALQAA